MKKIIFVVLLCISINAYADTKEFIINGVKIKVWLPNNFAVAINNDISFNFSKKTDSVELNINFVVTSYKKIISSCPVESSKVFYNLLMQTNNPSIKEIYALMDKYPPPVLFGQSKYDAYSGVKRVNLKDGCRGEQYYSLGLDNTNGLSWPFTFSYCFPTKYGMLEIDFGIFDSTKDNFDKIMMPYGLTGDGYLEYVGQKQVDKIFNDITTGVFKGYPELIELYHIYQNILKTLEISYP